MDGKDVIKKKLKIFRSNTTEKNNIHNVQDDEKMNKKPKKNLMKLLKKKTMPKKW